MNRAYGLRPDSIDYDQFRIDDDDKTLFWTPGDKKISISSTRTGVRFLALSTLASRYGVGGTDALRRSLGLTGYTRKGLSSSAVKALQRADKTLSSNLDNIELEDLPGIADSARQSVEQVETTIDGQPIDTRRPTILITVGQGPTALAVGAGGGCLDIFTFIYPFSSLSPSLWETARYIDRNIASKGP